MNLNPTKPQFDYLTAEEPFPAMVAGFGSGKTEAAVARSIIGKLKYPTCNRGFYEPTYDLVRMIAFPRFEEMLTKLNIPYKLYKSPLNYIEIEGAGKILFRSMDAPSRIIGYEHSDADCDELDTLKRDDAADVWRRVLSRNRQNKPDGTPNTIGVTTTPEGFRFVYDTWKRNPKDGYRIIQAPTSSNPHLPEGYIDSLKSIYPESLLMAYLDGKFVNLASGTVYNAFNRVLHNSKEQIKEREPLYIGMDFNVTNMSAVVYVKRGKVFHAVREYLGLYDTKDMARAIKENHVNHRITVYPDASGSSRKTVDASISDIAILEREGFNILAKKTNPRVKDRIIATNSALENGNLFVNVQECPRLAESFEQLAYNAAGEPDKTSGLDHIVDAGTYPIAYEFPVVKPVAALDVRFSI